MSEMRILDETGDSKQVWDPDDEDSVEATRDMYNKLKKKGYQAFEVNDKGGKGKLMLEFNPKAGKIIMAPKPAGG